MDTRWRKEISSLSQALDFLTSSKKVGRALSLSLVTGRAELWFSKGEIVDVSGSEFSFATDTGENVLIKINLSDCTFETPSAITIPSAFQPQMPLAEVPTLQAQLTDGQVLRLFEDAEVQANEQATHQL